MPHSLSLEAQSATLAQFGLFAAFFSQDFISVLFCNVNSL